MKKKGFTLIELLAVIVILAIITVIAVPKILDVIEKSKESSAESSIKLVKDAIKTQIVSGDALNESNFIKNNDGCYLFDFDDQSTGNSEELKLKNKDKISGSITYCNGTFKDDTLKFDGTEISKDDNNNKIICKRATTLHTEECTQTDTANFCSATGYTTSGSKGTTTITYGNLGTKGTLTSGDAFDCDVNGDGTYDSTTERFYYVTDMSNDAAVLIYYNNVSAGSPSNSAIYAYDSSGENWHGPRTAITELPTTTQWKNVSLTNSTRAITNESGGNTTTGGTLPSNFSYSGYAARLLTTQEVNNACNITVGNIEVGELDTCNYLLENTKYSNDSIENGGYWLENARAATSSGAHTIIGYGRFSSYGTVSHNSGANGRGVRPVIEVSKVNILY
mgnify:CR=1 FL=1